MCKFWNKFCGKKHKSSAKVVDGSLIVSLPNAINPVVWRMELGNIKASAMEVRANDNHYLLALKTPKGEVHDIAPFETHDDAVNALMCVSHALERPERKAIPAAPSTLATAEPYAVPKRGTGWKWFFGILAALVLFFFIYAMTVSVPVTRSGASATGQTGSTQGESGVPLSADEYLRGF